MSIVSEIERIKSNISNAYNECASKNATMPEIQNSENLPSTIASITTGGGGPQYPIIEGTGKHEVRFIDYDGTILKIQYVNDGETVTPPQTPEHERLTFVEWNREYDNVTHDLDVGALYTTVSGNTELFIDVTEETGLKVTLNLYKGTATGTVTIDWGDGTTTNARVTTSRSVTHTYTNYGEYMISIIGSFGYALGGASAAKPLLKGANEVTTYNLLKKCYCSSGVTVIKNYCFFNNFNLEEFTAAHLVEIWQYVFFGTKQKTLFVPPNVAVINLYIISNCTSLKYFILPTNITSISYPAFRCSDLEKMIFPENYELTTYTYGILYNATKYFWYKKPSNDYILSSNFASNAIFLEKIPIYDNLTAIKSYGNFSYSNIKKIAFPPSLKEMDNGVFTSCSALTDVYMYAHTPPTLGGTSIFSAGNSNLKIHVYPEDLEAYQTATNWSSLSSKLVGDLEGEFKDGYCE